MLHETEKNGCRSDRFVFRRCSYPGMDCQR
nr:MAG TPA: hypothetical protein [Caudoviricetes sp.]